MVSCVIERCPSSRVRRLDDWPSHRRINVDAGQAEQRGLPVHQWSGNESVRRPTAGLDRNLACLGLVEVPHGYPLDGAIFTTGCDKTTPAALMAAVTTDLPALIFNCGPMLNSYLDGQPAGAGTIIWEARRRRGAGELDEQPFMDLLAASTPSAGHCNVMNTAIGDSTNCPPHLLAIARHAGVDLRTRRTTWLRRLPMRCCPQQNGSGVTPAASRRRCPAQRPGSNFTAATSASCTPAPASTLPAASVTSAAPCRGITIEHECSNDLSRAPTRRSSRRRRWPSGYTSETRRYGHTEPIDRWLSHAIIIASANGNQRPRRVRD